MKKSKNNSEVKKLNRNRVFRYINSKEKTSMPEVAAALHMSSPTVLQIVRELNEAGVLLDAGELESNGGRKPKALTTVKDIRYALGIEITQNHIGIVLTDLTKAVKASARLREKFVFEDAYFKTLGRVLEEFVEEEQVDKDKVTGVGISVPAIVDMPRNYITYSRALNLYDVAGDVFSRYIPYPCTLINDASAAAASEWGLGYLKENLVYLSLSNTVGGAILFQNSSEYMEDDDYSTSVFENMYIGNHWHSGEFGHLTIHPDGDTCYCGKKGCVDAYCSALRLSKETDGQLEQFFVELEKENPEIRKAWDTYLEDLSIAVDNLRMCFDCEVVLGGYVGSCMKPYISELRDKVARRNIFEGAGDYISVCTFQNEASALGAAVFYIEDFMNSI
ncbi:putative NBD/HSP70 family sugar kinase [Muricomes intestini]|jgi:predicted NBD/HSP70 family sugar kinase|uniref:Putative NBD/HSP70 family sugar kinase n=1 Tax=Muricomes intestini TaxID=1796634 RepID=A0A4R3K5M7_9FIRM|nr:ROK family transcriptional regulator [Muricomes intestini]TCS78079.1 putative NBD/HSP70 family sugar kinase [Muricomes intestini]